MKHRQCNFKYKLMRHDANGHKIIPQNTVSKYKTQYDATKHSVMNQMPQSMVPTECPLRSIKLKAKVLIAMKVIFRWRKSYIGREELHTDRMGAEMGGGAA